MTYSPGFAGRWKAKTFPYSHLESWQNTYTYNDDNQMVAATVCEGNLTKKYTFTYDANGNLTHECFGQQAEVVYQYDTENRLTAVYDQQKLVYVYKGNIALVYSTGGGLDTQAGFGLSDFLKEYQHLFREKSYQVEWQ